MDDQRISKKKKKKKSIFVCQILNFFGPFRLLQVALEAEFQEEQFLSYYFQL